MAFPEDPLDLGVEIEIDGEWVDITEYVYGDPGIEIARGRADEGEDTEPARMTLEADALAGDGYLNWRLPTSPNFGKVGRNTPIRSWVKLGQPRLVLQGGDQFRTADSAALSITGDIDLRIDVVRSSWRQSTAEYAGLIKGGAYALYITTGGKLGIQWFSASVSKFLTSSEPIPGPLSGRKSVRATLDVNNGSGGHTARFYYSDDDTMDGSWVQFGDAQVGSGTTSIDDSSQTLGAYSADAMEINEIRVYDGIAGTKRASPKFTAQASGTTSFADAEANTWANSPATTAELTNRHVRFTGNVSEWQLRHTGTMPSTYLRAQIVAQGVQRRLGQGRVLRSSMARAVPTEYASTLVAYWPLEDGQGAATLEHIGPYARPGRVIGSKSLGSVGNPDMGGYTDFLASDAAPVLGTGRLYLPIAASTNTQDYALRFLARFGATRPPDNTVLIRYVGAGELTTVDIVYRTGGSLQLKAYDKYGGTQLTGTIWDFSDQLDDRDVVIRLEMDNVSLPANTVMQIAVRSIGGYFYYEGLEAVVGPDLGLPVAIDVNPARAALGDTAIGHVHVLDESAAATTGDYAIYSAYWGEEAHERIVRLGDESGFGVEVAGSGGTSVHMGPQEKQAEVLDLLRSAARSDGGILVDSREAADTVRYRTRAEIENGSAVTLSYADKAFALYEPIGDDRNTRNRVTVQRAGGTSAIVEDDESAMGTQDPPNGVGVYDESVTVSLYSNDQATQQAGWRVALGTVDADRVPQLGANLAHPFYAGDDELLRALLSLDCGDRITITDPPAWLAPDDSSQVVQGYRERFWQFGHEITWNLAPASPYRVAVYDGHPDYAARFSNENTVLTAVMDETTTLCIVNYIAGPDWTHDDGDYDIMINGERMTVTAKTGGTPGLSSVLTVTRSVNGVVAEHTLAYPVTLADPVRYSVGALGQSEVEIGPGITVNAMDHRLPDVAAEYGNGINTITATAFAALPTTPISAEVVNPHPTKDMLCIVGFGAWISANTNDVRLCFAVTSDGEDYLAAGIGASVVGWGEIPAILSGASGALEHAFATTTVSLPPSTSPWQFEMQAYRAGGSGTSQQVRYPTIRIIPLRFE